MLDVQPSSAGAAAAIGAAVLAARAGAGQHAVAYCRGQMASRCCHDIGAMLKVRWNYYIAWAMSGARIRY